MKILLAARGAQGDVYPYMALAKKLQEAGDSVTLNAPYAFEDHARKAGISFVPENDDIAGLMDSSSISFGELLKWTDKVIDHQFETLLPLAEKHDIFITSNTEFAAPTISEFTGKPYIRTAYAPLIPSPRIMPPVTPLQNANFFLRPSAIWAAISAGLNLMGGKRLNKWRAAHGMSIEKSHAQHAPSHSFNCFFYSEALGESDPVAWNKYRWTNGGYLFYDDFPFEQKTLDELDAFFADGKPVLFFSLGSAAGVMHDRFSSRLYDICKRNGFKLLIGCGWKNIGKHLAADGKKHDDLFLLDKLIPHRFVFPHCTALVHHGGCGTLHNAARFCKPQVAAPHVIDQFYWAKRIKDLGLGPAGINMKKITAPELEKVILNLMSNRTYISNSQVIAQKPRAEIENCKVVEFIHKLV